MEIDSIWDIYLSYPNSRYYSWQLYNIKTEKIAASFAQAILSKAKNLVMIVMVAAVSVILRAKPEGSRTHRDSFLRIVYAFLPTGSFAFGSG